MLFLAGQFDRGPTLHGHRNHATAHRPGQGEIDRDRIQGQSCNRFQHRPFETTSAAKHAIANLGPVLEFSLLAGQYDEFVRLAQHDIGLDEYDQRKNGNNAEKQADAE